MFDRHPILAVGDAVRELQRQGSIEGITQWIIDNPYPVYYLGRYNCYCEYTRKRWNETPEVMRPVRITLDVRWSPMVSNSHSAPSGFEQNFNRDRTKPLGYPGWVGNVSYSVPSEWGSNFNLNNVLRHVRIFTGTGTGSMATSDGYRRGQYGVELFDADFPVLAMVRNLTA